MRALITGGAGFIGSHLAERCLMEGWKVVVLDDLSTGSLANTVHLKERTDFQFAFGSVTDRPLLAELIEGSDVVYHLAAAVGVRLIVENPVRTMTTNVHGTEAVLAAAERARVPVFIASTSEVYGKSTAIPFREDADLVLGATTKARWSYAASKALDEFLGIAYWNHNGVPATIVRFFNTVGPRQSGRYGMVLPTFVRQAIRGDVITVFGDGEQRRCFSYVGDVVEALIRLARAPGISGEVINIGNDREITMNELAVLVKAIANSNSPITHIPYDSAYGPGFEDMFRRVPCLEKLRRLTGYRPETPIRKIVAVVVEHELANHGPLPRLRAAAVAGELASSSRSHA
jgi:UDP-glucose 4-epimerase